MNSLFGGLLANSFFPVFAVVAFVAVVLFIEALYLVWNNYKGPEAKRVEQRLRALSAGADGTERTALLKRRMLSDVPQLERLLLSIPRIHGLDRIVVQSGLGWSIGKLIGLTLGCGLLTALALAGVHGVQPLLKTGIALAAAAVPGAYVLWHRSRRLARIVRQLPDTLDLITRALRAGHALPAALKMAGDELPEPLGNEFRITHDEINFGVSMQQALHNLSERIPIADVRYLVVAVMIQRESGGNLAEVLGNLAKLIRERLKFQARVKVLTTEGRMSAWVLGLLPFALAALLHIANPDFISVLWKDPIGITITNVMLGMMAVGALWLYKLIQLRV